MFVFQSTLPVRGATASISGGIWAIWFQSKLPVRGATAGDFSPAIIGRFNPRSPCGERRGTGKDADAKLEFQSTLPVRGATQWQDG